MFCDLDIYVDFNMGLWFLCNLVVLLWIKLYYYMNIYFRYKCFFLFFSFFYVFFGIVLNIFLNKIYESGEKGKE